MLQPDAVSTHAMEQTDDIEQLALAWVAAQCADQSDRFFRRESHDPRFCFELLRRALALRDALAWEQIYRQYQPLVVGWVTRHPAFERSGEDAGAFVNAAFERLWSAIPPERFAQFPDLASLLRYLQMCVHSVLTDHARSAAQSALTLMPEMVDDRLAQPDIAVAVADRAAREAFWALLRPRLRDRREREVVYAAYILGLKPREICQHYSASFPRVADVYRVKENLLERLRRDPELRRLVSDDA
jgi:RNA polymerase sigma factor (sigma-70 family)